MNFSKLLKAIAFLGFISTAISASAAPVSCTWQYAGGGGGGSTWVNADVCLQYIYSGTQIVGANHIATRTKTYYNGYLQQCTITLSTGYGYSGSCASPSFYTTTSVASSSSSSSARTILFSATCPTSPQTEFMSCMESNGRRCGSMNGVGVGSNSSFICYAK